MPGTTQTSHLAAGPSPAVDLRAHTASALDWGVVLNALSGHAATVAGQRAARELVPATDLDTIRAIHAQVSEVIALDEEALRLPLGGLVDLEPMVDQARRDSVLDLDQVRDLVGGVAAIDRLARWIARRREALSALAEVAIDLVLDPDFVDLCLEAIDSEGNLSAGRWPELGVLRARVRELSRGIRSRMEELASSDDFSDYLQDRFITQREGRFVLPMKASAPRSIGIVHGMSNTGETFFVEPGEIVARSNRLREAEGELQRLERRILSEITVAVSAAAARLVRGHAASVHLDLVQARADLGNKLGGRIHPMGTAGVLRLRAARHPVLVLRGIPVVANDLAVDSATPCLLLTGPNTGGKTVALKTLGLAALFCRTGIPFPAEDGSRIDLFGGVVADVGDIQTVWGDLSTFSGHIAVMKATLEAARPDSLVLLDEVGVGTDPAQGAPLARAILEALVDTGARVAATTHYAEVKALPAADARFAIAAMQYAHGRPTYKVAPGLAGQSHAFAIASRLHLHASIIERARALMDTGSRQIGDLMEALEAQRAETRMLQEALEERERVVAERERKYEARKQSLESRRRNLEREIAARFTKRLRDREGEVKALIATLQEQPDLDLAGRSLKRIKDIRTEVDRRARPKVPDQPPPPKSLQKGDPVLIRSLGQRGVVTEDLGRDRYQVKVGVLSMKLKRAELARVDARGLVVAEGPSVSRAPKQPPPAPKPPPRAEKVARADLAGLRMDFNTLDLRGQRVDDALEALPSFLDKMTLEGRPVAFVLHGHGTGALKKAVREWIPKSGYVRAWRPCDPGEGGDAYTIVGLR